jgi:hypothetical protein
LDILHHQKEKIDCGQCGEKFAKYDDLKNSFMKKIDYIMSEKNMKRK